VEPPAYRLGALPWRSEKQPACHHPPQARRGAHVPGGDERVAPNDPERASRNVPVPDPLLELLVRRAEHLDGVDGAVAGQSRREGAGEQALVAAVEPRTGLLAPRPPHAKLLLAPGSAGERLDDAVVDRPSWARLDAASAVPTRVPHGAPADVQRYHPFRCHRAEHHRTAGAGNHDQAVTTNPSQAGRSGKRTIEGGVAVEEDRRAHAPFGEHDAHLPQHRPEAPVGTGRSVARNGQTIRHRAGDGSRERNCDRALRPGHGAEGIRSPLRPAECEARLVDPATSRHDPRPRGIRPEPLTRHPAGRRDASASEDLPRLLAEEVGGTSRTSLS
jgi:hypothetical protein